MNVSGGLLCGKALHGEAEPLMRRALAVFFASLGTYVILTLLLTLVLARDRGAKQ